MERPNGLRLERLPRVLFLSYLMGAVAQTAGEGSILATPVAFLKIFTPGNIILLPQSISGHSLRCHTMKSELRLPITAVTAAARLTLSGLTP